MNGTATYREGRLLLPNTVTQKDEKPHTAGLDDTAIPHTKIKITEIPLGKKGSIPQRRKPPCPPHLLAMWGFCKQTQNLGTSLMHRIGFFAHLMINENHHHARCCHLYIKQLVIHTTSSAFILWSVRGWRGGGITSAFRERGFTFSIKFLWRVTYNGP